MKEITETIGIDVSKLTIDAHLHVKKVRSKFENQNGGFKELLKWVKTYYKSLDGVLFCFEHTGMYSMQLASFLTDKKTPFAMVPGLEIKRSLGLVRGKNDKIDAQRIAEYCFRRRDDIHRTVLPSKELLQLKSLLSMRDRMVVNRAGYITTVKELKSLFGAKENKDICQAQENVIAALSKSIKSLEEKIDRIIKNNTEIYTLYKLVTSIKGIGRIVAINLIVVTNCFTSFETSRQLACYSGIAPFEKQSGTSLNARSSVSHYANKKLKALLNLSANSAAQTDHELRAYYARRVQQGKSKMSTLNIIRNKLLHRVFAVVRRKTPYVNIQKWAA